MGRKYRQLFRQLPNEEFMDKLVPLYGCSTFDKIDNHQFTREQLDDWDTVGGLEILREELLQYYVPCKARIYLNNITVKRAVTIFRQMCRSLGYNVKSCEKYRNGKKYLMYQVRKIEIANDRPPTLTVQWI